jgi:hypothetical protein
MEVDGKCEVTSSNRLQDSWPEENHTYSAGHTKDVQDLQASQSNIFALYQSSLALHVTLYQRPLSPQVALTPS